MSNYPEHDKVMAVKDETEPAAAFIEWLGTQHLHLGRVEDGHRYLQPVHESLTTLLARWKGIDLAEFDREDAAILAKIREGNQAQGRKT